MEVASRYDAIVVGSGPNGFGAGITLARQGLSVLMVEARETVGGGMRSLPLTGPGYRHDICSAIHPMGLASPFFKSLPLDEHGLAWIYPPAELAHPLDDGTAVMVRRSVEETGEGLGPDAATYRRLMTPLVENTERILAEILGPLRFPRYPFALARVGAVGGPPATMLGSVAFSGERAKALLAGMAAHSIMPLERAATAAVGLVLNLLAHRVGWPLPKGGSQSIANALESYFCSLGGQVLTGHRVQSLEELPEAKIFLLNTSPREMRRILGDKLPAGYQRLLDGYRYGPGVFKVDYALSEPVPWAAPEASEAATVHLGGTMEEIADSERAMWNGHHSDSPYVLVAQQSLFDDSRAPQGKHTLWAYCHVPHGSTVDMTDAIDAQIERFAPGFRDCIIKRATRNTAEYEAYNPNYVGGDINSGVQDLFQLFTRPVPRPVPYSTPVDGVYLASSAVPPGGGVHGMGGYFAARAALRKHFGITLGRAP